MYFYNLYDLRTPYTDHHVLPREPLPGEAENVLRGSKYTKSLYLRPHTSFTFNQKVLVARFYLLLGSVTEHDFDLPLALYPFLNCSSCILS